MGKRSRDKRARRERGGPRPATGGQWLIPWLLIGAGVAGYHNSFSVPFIGDDISSIPDNPYIRQLWPIWAALRTPPETTVARRPIVNLSLALNHALDGLNVWGYHAFNVAVHITSALVLFGVIRRTLSSERFRGRYSDAAPWFGMAVALIWMVHPLQTEAVTYIIQRTELLMGLFYLLTLYCVIRGVSSRHSAGWYALSVGCCALGMGSKEVMVSAPLAVCLYDRVFLSASFREIFRRRGGLYAGMAATWLILPLLVALRPSATVGLGFESLTPWDYAKTQAGVIVHYLRLSIWPHPLVLDYDDWPIARTVHAVAGPALLVVALVGGTAWAFRRRPELGFLGACFFLILAPTSSFLPIITEVAAERRMYLPLALLVVLGVVGGDAVLSHLFRRRGWRDSLRPGVEIALVLGVVAASEYATVQRNEDYRTNISIWNDVVTKRPNNARGHNLLGYYLYQAGKADEALGHFSRAVQLKPNDARAHNNLGNVLARQGKLAEASVQYSEALRIRPDFAEAHNNLGVALAGQGRLAEAIAQYSEALRINPDYAEAHYALGNALGKQGRVAEAVAHYAEALRLNPDYAEAHNNLGNMLTDQGKLAEAAVQYAEALRVNPNLALTHYNLGLVLVKQGRASSAAQHFAAAARLDPRLQPPPGIAGADR